MNEDPNLESLPPVSSFAGPIAELVGQQMLAPPARPGLLAALGPYEVVRVLGGGGMGVVLLARDSAAGKNVAIKMIKSELAGDQRAGHRFVKEAGHLQKLQHPNIVPVLEVSDRAAGAYFVMPYFERGSLAGRIRPGQPLDAVFILDIARDIAEGLRFAHQRGIIHRDLKPANILLGTEGRACLADFGLARSLFNDTIMDVAREQFEGTAPYMSPGVAAGHAEDTRCDIYAFGALLYEMLTGEPPYSGASTREIRAQILAGPPRPIRERNPSADSGLVTIAEGAMARELRNRYADMNDVAADLRRMQEGRTPVGPRGGSAQMVRRTPLSIWILAAAALLSLLAWLLPPKPRKIPSAPHHAPVAVSPSTVPPAPILPAPAPPRTNSAGPGIILAGAPGNLGSADGPSSAARFHAPEGIVVDGSGAVFVADAGNNAIRKISPDGVVSTFAGLPGSHGSIDSGGSAARFWAPFGLALDGAGNLYVADLANSAIRKITSDGVVSTLAGLAGDAGSADGLGIHAQFRNPWSVAVDTNGVVYVADASNFTIRKVTPTGQVSTMAGAAGMLGSADGPASAARFWEPRGIAVDKAGALYITDSGNHTIRKITRDGLVVTLAGSAGNPGNVDGVGADARFASPQGIAVAADGFIYVAEPENRRLRRINADGVVSTIPRPAASVGGAGFRPSQVAVSVTGDLYVTDSTASVIWKIPASK
ncbi:MAG TPA: protein kinase [Verrucomicrobiae bacterium]|jgi:serine/threonine protein kinase/sugar lactone lactonase YvrE|nr:protein kinase [Verrucomicrobiae bacterium]